MQSAISDRGGEHIVGKSSKLGRLLDKGVRGVTFFTDRVGYLSGFLVGLSMVSIVPDVLLRLCFRKSLRGVVEFNELLIVAIVFLGLARNQAKGSNVRVEIFVSRLSSKMQERLRVLADVIGLLVFAGIGIYGTVEAYFSVLLDERNWAVIRFPVWPARILLAFGALLLCCELLLDIARRVRKLRYGELSTEER